MSSDVTVPTGGESGSNAGILALPLVGASTLYSMKGYARSADDVRRLGRIKGQNAIAVGSRRAIEEGRRGDIIISNARAAMAAGGGVTTDAGALYDLSQIGEKAGYNSLVAMYEGKVKRQTILEDAETEARRLEDAEKGSMFSGLASMATIAAASFFGGPAGGAAAAGAAAAGAG